MSDQVSTFPSFICNKKIDKCICLISQECILNEEQYLFEPLHSNDASEKVLFITSEFFQRTNEEDPGMNNHSSAFQRQHISSKNTFPFSMHNKCNHVCSQQPIYPSYILPSPLFPSDSYSPTLYPIQLSTIFFTSSTIHSNISTNVIHNS